MNVYYDSVLQVACLGLLATRGGYLCFFNHFFFFSRNITHLCLPHPRSCSSVKKAWGKTTSRITIRTSPLRANKNDSNSNSNNNNKEEDGRRLESLKSSVVQRLPPKLVEFLVELWEKLMSALPSIKIAALSFLAGTVLTFGAILIPVYNSVETLAEPVTLFETILGDLERGYVEEVDTQKLFETGISAMLKSLDPYTEFEGKQQAVELTESIGGQYAGVGLVISGATPKDIALMEEAQQNSQDTNIIPSNEYHSIDCSNLVVVVVLLLFHHG